MRCMSTVMGASLSGAWQLESAALLLLTRDAAGR